MDVNKTGLPEDAPVPPCLSRYPISIRRTITTAPTGPIICAELKLLYVHRGRTRIQHEAGEIDLQQGSFVLLPAERIYVGMPSVPVETLTIYLDPNFVQDQVRWLPATAPFLELMLGTSEPRLLSVQPPQRAAFQYHLHKFARINPASLDGELQQVSHLASTIALLNNGGVPRESGVEGRAEIDAAIQLFEEHPQYRWSILDLAGAVSLSPSHLTRLFIQHTGSPPHRYLREIRAYRMRGLLKEHMTVGEAARAVGWTNTSHAARSFRAVFGHSPTEAVKTRGLLNGDLG